MSPQYIKPDTIEFLHEMKQLRFFKMLAARLQDKNYRPILALENLEYLAISGKDVKSLYADFVKLPKLKWGWGWKEQPDL